LAGFADVAVIGTIVVEIVVELVRRSWLKLLEEIVGVLFAAGFAGAWARDPDLPVALARSLMKTRTRISWGK